MAEQNVQHGTQPSTQAEVQHGTQPQAEATVEVQPNGSVVADVRPEEPPQPGSDEPGSGHTQDDAPPPAETTETEQGDTDTLSADEGAQGDQGPAGDGTEPITTDDLRSS